MSSAPRAVLWISLLGGQQHIPHSHTPCRQNASAVRKTAPILCWLRTLSSTTMSGTFLASWNASGVRRFISCIVVFCIANRWVTNSAVIVRLLCGYCAVHIKGKQMVSSLFSWSMLMIKSSCSGRSWSLSSVMSVLMVVSSTCMIVPSSPWSVSSTR